MKKKGIVFCLLLLLTLTAACSAKETAAVLRLFRAQGTVLVWDDKEAEIEPREDMGLYGGYRMVTRKESYGWITLDTDRLAKLDEESSVDIAQSGRKLELELQEGSLFFRVDKPLEEDETLDIRTSNMIVGIRGTCGWVAWLENGHLRVCLLKGKVACTVTLPDGSEVMETIEGGQCAELDPSGEIVVTELRGEDIPAFVEEELSEDAALTEIRDSLEETKEPPEASLGSSEEAPDLPAETSKEPEEIWDSLEDYAEFLDSMPVSDGTSPGLLYAEILDFEADGRPELLALFIREESRDVTESKGICIYIGIYRRGPEGILPLIERQSLVGSPSLSDSWYISLMESGGRLFLHEYEGLADYVDAECVFYAGFWLYYGSVAPEEGESWEWGTTDLIQVEETKGSPMLYFRQDPVESGLVVGATRECSLDEFQAVQEKYTEVKELLRSEGGGRILIAPW